MPTMHIDRSVFIKRKPEDVFTILNDFHHWRNWSPWLIMEKDVKVDVAEDGKHYSWEGDLVGSGNMTVLREKEFEQIDYDLTFLKPWKSKAQVGFILKPKDDGTEVHWTMESRWPFFLFWMKKRMEALIGMDYQRGLYMLKDYAEDSTVHSKLEFVGVEEFSGCKYVGIKTECTIDTVGEQMSNDFKKLLGFMMKEHKEQIAGNSFTIYHKWDMVRNKVVYTSSVPVFQIPENLPEDFVSGEIPEMQIYTTRHTGPYRHIGNAWSAMYSRQRAKVFKVKKGIDPIEVYLNSPEDTPENELQSEIKFPVVS